MRKWIVAGVVFVALGVVVFVALLNVNSFIKRNKDYLLDQAQQALNRKISVGEAEVTFLQGIGVRVKSFAMADDPAFSTEDFVRAKDLQINLKFWSLLRKQVRVKRVILHEPSISIVRHANGDFNFSSIGEKEKAKRKEQEKERTPREPRSTFLISLVDISGGNVRYRDQKDGTDVELQQVDLKLEDLDSDKPFGVQLAAALFTPKQNLHLKTRVGPTRPEQNFDQLPLDGSIQIDAIDLGKLRSAVPRIKTYLPSDWELSGVFRIKDVKFKGTLENLALQGDLEGTEGLVRFGNGFQKPPGIRLVVSTDAQYANNTVVLREAQIKLHTLELASQGQVRLGDVAEVSLSLDSKPASLDGWDKIVPAMQNYQLAGKMDVRATVRGKLGRGAVPGIQGVVNLTGVSGKPPQFPQPIRDLNTTINFSGQKANIKETTLTLGNSRIRLTANIERFSPLALTYGLSTPEIRPADFEAQLAEDRKSDVIKNLTSNGQLAMRDGSVTFQGKLVSTQGILYKKAYTNLEATFSLAKKIANIRNLRVNALSGALQAEGEYAFNETVPRFSLASKMQGVDVKELYNALSSKAAHDIRGRLNGGIKISGSGHRWDEIQPTLRGQGEAEVLQGALLNFNIAEGALSGIIGMLVLTNMINPRLRKKYPATFEAKDTEFKELKGLFDLADGRINVKDLRIAAADYSAQGNGWVDFDRKVHFRSVLTFSQPLSVDIAQSAREVKYLLNNQNQLEIPFTLTGRLPNVRPKPDASYLAKVAQRALLGKGTEELQRKFGNKDSTASEEAPAAESKKRKKGSTEDLIRKGLEGLFKR